MWGRMASRGRVLLGLAGLRPKGPRNRPAGYPPALPTAGFRPCPYKGRPRSRGNRTVPATLAGLRFSKSFVFNKARD